MFYNEELINIHPELRSAIEKVSPFCKQPLPRVHFSGDGVRTDEGDTSSVYEGINLPVACFNADVLADVLPSIEKVDWSYYPKPCPFSGCGGKLEGLIMGLRT
jgi:hypothetical protein